MNPRAPGASLWGPVLRGTEQEGWADLPLIGGGSQMLAAVGGHAHLHDRGPHRCLSRPCKGKRASDAQAPSHSPRWGLEEARLWGSYPRNTDTSAKNTTGRNRGGLQGTEPERTLALRKARLECHPATSSCVTSAGSPVSAASLNGLVKAPACQAWREGW